MQNYQPTVQNILYKFNIHFFFNTFFPKQGVLLRVFYPFTNFYNKQDDEISNLKTELYHNMTAHEQQGFVNEPGIQQPRQKIYHIVLLLFLVKIPLTRRHIYQNLQLLTLKSEHTCPLLPESKIINVKRTRTEHTFRIFAFRQSIINFKHEHCFFMLIISNYSSFSAYRQSPK